MTRGPAIDPIVIQIVEGTLASVEAEVEAAIERTSRSPMIREARDFRAGIHDRRCRKLTGRIVSSGKSRTMGCTSAEYERPVSLRHRRS